jgi:hypothetical protein
MTNEELIASLIQPGGYLDESLGVQAPAMPPEEPPQQFRVSPYQSFLERFAGAMPEFQRPRTFGQGLISGFAGGLSGAGTRVSQARQKFETRQEARRLQTDEARRKATEDYNKRRAEAVGELAKETRQRRYKAEDITAEQTAGASLMTPTLAKRYPALAEVYPVGQTIPERVIKSGLYTTETPSERAAAANAAVQLDPVSRAMISRLVLQTGDPRVAVLGRGKAATEQAAGIINDAARMEPEADLAFNRAGYGADKASLQKAQTNYDGFKSYEAGALYNMKPLTDYLSKVPDLGNTPMNGWARAAALSMGSKDMAAFRVYVNSVSTEAGRLINNANVYNDLTETSRKDLDALKRGSLTGNQMMEALAALRTEFANRGRGQKETIDIINERIKQRRPGREAVSDSTRARVPALTDEQARAEYETYRKGKR